MQWCYVFEMQGIPCLVCCADRTVMPLALDPLEVLQTMREFMHHFYYCRDCSKHFEGMAKESMDQVKSRDEAILWLWERHNTVNMRVKSKDSTTGTGHSLVAKKQQLL